MKSSRLIRMLDLYLGVIICGFFSIINTILPKRRPAKIKSILFIELFEMGAAIMAYPSIKYAKESKDKPHIYCLCTNEVRQSWEILGIIPKEDIYSIRDKNLFMFASSLAKNIRLLRKKNIDFVIDFGLFYRISSIISFLATSKHRAGFYKYRMEGLFRGTFYDIRCSFNQNMHISKNFLALTKTALSQGSDNPNYKNTILTEEITLPKYASNPDLRKSIAIKIKKIYPEYSNQKIVLIGPDVGAELRVRNYPLESYAQVIKKLLKNDPLCLVILIGVAENKSVCSSICMEVKDKRCINFCGKTESLKELMELMCLSSLYIGNDNGLAHFASLTKIKILALFSTDTPYMYGPLGDCVVLYSFFHCSPCISAWNHKSTPCKNNLCLKAINPDIVYRFAVRHMHSELKPRTVNNSISYI